MSENRFKEGQDGHPLHDLMGMIADRQGDNASWPLTICLIAGLVIALSFMGVQLAMAKRKAAKLASKLRIDEEARDTAREEQKRADSEGRREEAFKRAVAANKRVRATSFKLLDLKSVHENRLNSLNAITSWDDVLVVDKRIVP